jgi:hypothetical protein
VSRPTFRTLALRRPFAYGAITRYGRPFQAVLLVRLAFHVQAVSRSLATTREISVDFFSYRYLDVSVPYVRVAGPMYSAQDNRTAPIGFPHSDILGSKLVASSPGLFAGCHVFHRLLLPRHSPCALNFLTI